MHTTIEVMDMKQVADFGEKNQLKIIAVRQIIEFVIDKSR